MIGNNFKHTDITNKILKAYFNVYNTLGYGFLEKVYENSMIIELTKAGLVCEKQKPIVVYYDNSIVGEYFADLLVEGKVIIELKTVETMINEHEIN
jgi:GxxExxY protein